MQVIYLEMQVIRLEMQVICLEMQVIDMPGDSGYIYAWRCRLYTWRYRPDQ
jgi:hypothetical protein